MAATSTAVVYSREFHGESEALALPFASVASFQDLIAILFKIHKQDETTHDVHIHLDDVACNGIVSDVTWNAGVYVTPTQERLNIFPHFVEKGVPYSTYARPESQTPSSVAAQMFLTPVRNGINKGSLTAPKRSQFTPINSTRLTASAPRNQTTRSQETPMARVRPSGDDEDSAVVSVEMENGNDEGSSLFVEQGPTEDAEAEEPSGIANGIKHIPGPPIKAEEQDLDPSLMVNVTYTYYQGTAGVFRNFRVHSVALPLATDVDDIRNEITAAITHSINSSSRLRIFRSQVEFDIFISANQPGAQNHGLHDATTLGAHLIALGAAGGLLVNTYIYLSHQGVRYNNITDAIPDAEHAAAFTKAATRAVKAIRGKKTFLTPKKEPAAAEPDADEDAEMAEAAEGEDASGNESDASTFAPGGSSKKTRRRASTRIKSKAKPKALVPRSPSASPVPSPRPAKKQRRRAPSPPSESEDIIRENGIVVGQALRTYHADGRRNAIIACFSPAGRILFQAIDEDLDGNSISVRGNQRIMPDEVEYLREYRKLGRDQRRNEIKRKIEDAFGPA